MENVVIIVLSLLFSALFSGMEIAFVSSNKLLLQLDKSDNSLTSDIISIFYDHPQIYISTILVGNNICLVVFSIKMADLLAPYLAPITQGHDLLLAFMQSLIATIIVLFMGEYIPKSIFHSNANLCLRIFAPLLLPIYAVLYPVAMFVTWLSILIMKIFGVKDRNNSSQFTFTRADFNYLLQETLDTDTEQHNIEPEVKILQNALDLTNVKLRECYVPRTDITAMPVTASASELIKAFVQSGHSKIVVYADDIDNIVGYIHSNEMFNHRDEWQKHIVQMPIVPESMAAQKLMQLFLRKKKSMAIVVDEFGGTAGIITLEDIMEEIFGDIQDEHDAEVITAKQVSDNEYLVSGRLPVDEFNEKFALKLPESDNYETLAGLILHQCARFPKINEQLTINLNEDMSEGKKIKVQCLKITNNRIELVKITT
ncbi:MAG TPA: hemolysin [Bacteroidales bacterium]|nr:hemolysin [Bacteroidales bacterium]